MIIEMVIAPDGRTIHGKSKPTMVSVPTTGYCSACQRNVGTAPHLCEATRTFVPDSQPSVVPAGARFLSAFVDVDESRAFGVRSTT